MNKTLIVIFAFILVQCKSEQQNSEVISHETADTTLSNNGININYIDRGTGDTTLILVHGWAINKNYWQDQIEHFSKQYRVIAPDLPGFGTSSQDRKDWTVANYASDIASIINKLNLKNLILIGHSMSGVIVLETSLQNPDKVIAIVGVDNFKNFGVPEDPGSKKEYEEVYKQLRNNYTATITGYTKQMLLSPQTDSVISARVLHDFTSVDSVLAVDVMEENDKYPMDEKLKLYKKPLYLINSSLFPTDTSNFEKNKIRFKVYDVGKTGHYPMIEKPELFNTYLSQILNTLSN